MDTRSGSCLCGAVQFEVDGPIRGVGSCHCSKCRKVSGTGGNAQFLKPLAEFRWTTGADRKKRYQDAGGWGPTRCTLCGSPLPESYDGAQMWVPAGLMDAPLETDMKLHIFCGSRADWDVESPHASFHEEYPA